VPWLGQAGEVVNPRDRLALDPMQPLWPLLVIPVAILGVPWLVEVIGGLL
jgi:hypothetical protein